MKNVILGADNELKVYLVPDFIAESFGRYCTDFSKNWKTLQMHPQDGFGFDEKVFIEYLNDKICGDEKCVFVETLGWEYNPQKVAEQI